MRKRLPILLFFLFLLSFLSRAHTMAAQTPNGWNQGLAFATSHQRDAEQAIKTANLNNIPGMETNPPQTYYYGGVTQHAASQLQRDALAASTSDEGKAIVESFNTRARVTPDSQLLTSSEAIELHPASVIDPGAYYCMQGDCTDKSYGKNTSFNNALSALNANADAESYDNPASIFTGRIATCQKAVTGYNDCCKDSGWGKDLGLAHCSQAEKELGQSKEKGLTVYIGETCSHKTVLKVCTEHRRTYCVFPSITSFIMQTQGRRDQLDIGFGSTKHPNCRGLTADELSRINQSRIDWRAFYTTELHPNPPAISSDSSRIAQEVNHG